MELSLIENIEGNTYQTGIRGTNQAVWGESRLSPFSFINARFLSNDLSQIAQSVFT